MLILYTLCNVGRTHGPKEGQECASRLSASASVLERGPRRRMLAQHSDKHRHDVLIVLAYYNTKPLTVVVVFHTNTICRLLAHFGAI